MEDYKDQRRVPSWGPKSRVAKRNRLESYGKYVTTEGPNIEI